MARKTKTMRVPKEYADHIDYLQELHPNKSKTEIQRLFLNNLKFSPKLAGEKINKKIEAELTHLLSHEEINQIIMDLSIILYLKKLNKYKDKKEKIVEIMTSCFSNSTAKFVEKINEEFGDY